MSSQIDMHRFLVRLFVNKRYLLPRVFGALFFTIAMYRISYTIQNEATDNISIPDRFSPPKPEGTKSCRFPQLLADDPLIKKYFVEEKPLMCRKEKNWVYTDNGRFYIDKKAQEKHGEIDCDFYIIERIDDNHYGETKHESVKNDTPLLADMFRAECRGEDGDTYENLHVGVPLPSEDPMEEMEKVTSNSTNKGLKINVLMYLLDSVSRMHFIRKLPKFYKFLTEEMKGKLLFCD